MPLVPLVLRQDFPILGTVFQKQGKDVPLVYLDNAASTQKPHSVIDSISEYYTTSNANVHRGIHTLGERATSLLEDSREAVRKFINAEFLEEIIFTRGTTESINLVARTLPEKFHQGDEILISTMEHHSNLVPWLMAAERHGLKLQIIPVLDDGTLDLDSFETLLTTRTKLVAITQMSNVLGTINPVQYIIEKAHGKGIPVLIDGAQSVPHMKMDVRALKPDFLAFSGHKMCGPMGIGVLYAAKPILETLPPFHGGGEMIRSVRLDGFDLNDLPFRFEAGTPNVEGSVGMAAAIRYLEKVGLDAIHQHEITLTQRTLEGMSTIKGLRVLGSAKERGGIVAFDLPGIHAHDLAAFLDSRGIAIRAGHHCAHPLGRRFGVVSSARASFYLYNTVEEVDFFIKNLEEAVTVL